MTGEAQIGGKRGGMPWRIIGWGGAALLLVLPLVTRAPWTVSDFLFAALMLGSVGLGLELVAMKASNLSAKAGAAAAILASLLIVWVNGAVGMIGSEDDPYNLLFGAVLAVALVGAILARFRAAGLVYAMAAAGIVQAGLAAYGLTEDPRGGAFTLVLSGLWFLSAALFRKAARDRG